VSSQFALLYYIKAQDVLSLIGHANRDLLEQEYRRQRIFEIKRILLPRELSLQAPIKGK